MREANVSRKGLAARVRAKSQEDNGDVVSTTHTLVGKWLSGDVARPSERNCHLTAKVLSERLGRPISVRDIGYPDAEDTDSTLVYPADISDSVTSLTRLTTLDLGRIQDAAAKLLVVPEAWSELLVQAMYGDRSPVSAPNDTAEVTSFDVQQVRDATEMFSTFDHRYGGGRSRPLVATFFQTAVLPRLSRVPPTPVGREYFQAVAALTLRAGWAAYDVGDHGEGQRYLFQAYRLAEAADDVAFSAHALACMSHQANYLGHFQHAAHLARGAIATATGQATPAAMALFNSMEARALASQGNEAAATKALSTAEKCLDKRDPDDEPGWIWFFDRAELDAEFAHCFRDLGKADLANQHAAAAIDHAGGDFIRSSAFCRSVLATSYLLADDLEQALSIATPIVDSASQLQSARVITYLTDFRDQLRRVDSNSANEFDDRLTETLRLEGTPLAGRVLVP